MLAGYNCLVAFKSRWREYLEMAGWSASQRTRLAYEEALIREHMPHFWFRDHAKAGLTTVWGEHVTAANRAYTLCIWIKAGFPYEMPGLYVTSPCPLYGYRGKTIQSWAEEYSSHTMHVWKSDWNDYVKICHTKEEYWNASDTLLSILMKGMLWLEAFEVHYRTGQSIDSLSLSYR
jgi:hypothetical protein